MQQQSRPKALEGWMDCVYLGVRRVRCVLVVESDGRVVSSG